MKSFLKIEGFRSFYLMEFDKFVFFWGFVTRASLNVYS